MTEDAGSVLFEMLHSQVISYVFSRSDTTKHKCLANLEGLGFRVGLNLGEQLTKDIPRFKDDLEIMKFICRDFWSSIYQKQVDNLRTNHQGVYVLQDNNFRFLTHLSNGKEFIEHAPKFLAVPCGFVRGVLANLGINSVVTAEVVNMPVVKFQIMVQRT